MTGHHVRSYRSNVSTNDRPAHTAPADPDLKHYEIRVKGRLPERWSAWFDGLTIAADDDGTTVISGAVSDQAALHGLLQKLRDIGITLISLAATAPDSTYPNPTTRSNP
jgi:hypothetical protein